jgi:bacillopeptidase F
MIDGDYDSVTVVDMGAFEFLCNPSPEIKHDGIDQDCNGYDLTIDIITASYTTKKDKLVVDAISALAQAANLSLVGYGPMSWAGNKWTITIQPADGNPGTVTVSGAEGSESAPVN